MQRANSVLCATHDRGKPHDRASKPGAERSTGILNLDEWTEPNKRPDGSPHKFDVAYKNHPREGYIGLQDHGSNCWYRNIKLRVLK